MTLKNETDFIVHNGRKVWAVLCRPNLNPETNGDRPNLRIRKSGELHMVMRTPNPEQRTNGWTSIVELWLTGDYAYEGRFFIDDNKLDPATGCISLSDRGDCIYLFSTKAEREAWIVAQVTAEISGQAAIPPAPIPNNPVTYQAPESGTPMPPPE